jgi:hypothetical protein
MYGSAPPPSQSGSSGSRYAYLVGRLRTRQITMEEATELFGLMQGMLQRSEAARAAAAAAAGTGPARAPPPPPPPAPSGVPGTGLSDDTLMLGLLALGVGAGFVTALARRMQAGGLPPPKPASGSNGPAT